MKLFLFIILVIAAPAILAQWCASPNLESYCKDVSLKKKDSLSPPKYKEVTGNYCFEDKKKGLMVDGEFENGQLVNGREYVMDEFGLLEKIHVYKDGKFVSNAVAGDEQVKTVKDLREKETSLYPNCDGEKKNGFWKITGEMRKNLGYCDTCVIEEGEYIENRKHGLWKSYYPSGNIKNEINYNKGYASGSFSTYFDKPISKDTLNQLDENGKRNGYWIFRGKDKNEPQYCDTCKLEEGVYKVSRKQGVWTRYWPNGNVKSIIEYKNGKANGRYELHYDTGTLEENGIWLGNSNPEINKYFPS